MSDISKITDDLRTVLDFYQKLNSQQLYYKPIFLNGNSEKYVFLRLERATFDLRDGEKATLSRYAIWAEDIRFFINNAIEELENNNIEAAKEKLILSLNALGAFVDIMSVFDAEFFKPECDERSHILDDYSKFLGRENE